MNVSYEKFFSQQIGIIDKNIYNCLKEIPLFKNPN